MAGPLSPFIELSTPHEQGKKGDFRLAADGQPRLATVNRRLSTKLRWLWQENADGLVMLLISNAIAIGTAGLSLAAVLRQVRRVATQVGCVPIGHGQIAVLGAPVSADGPSEEFRERLLAGKRLLDDSDHRQLVLLGGRPHGGLLSEAACGRNFLMLHGVAEEAVTIEERSRHTLENLRNLRELQDPANAEPVVLLTHRYHAARVTAMAAGLGIRHEVVAADPLCGRCLGLARLGREAYLLHWYLVGKTVATWLHQRKSLAKIS